MMRLKESIAIIVLMQIKIESERKRETLHC